MEPKPHTVPGSPDDVAWMVVRAHLDADPQGREILLRLATAPAEGAELLRRYLGATVTGPGMTTIVTGGTVDRLVNIAQAGVVNIALRKPSVQPRQLPPAVADFTDRGWAVDRILDSVADRRGRHFAILGGGGIGKSALAVTVAHRLAERFSDAQLFVDLAGGTATPRGSAAVLEAMLRALGAEPDAIPADADERAALYRAMISGLRCVVLLDNAANATQLRPLVPGEGDHIVLVTSRDPLMGLAGFERVPLDVLEPVDAVDLLTRIIGPPRSREEPEALEELARLCGNLPLALRIAAARLASRPHRSIVGLVERLADENRRLSELEIEDLAVRGSFEVSYRASSPDSRRAFRLAALIPGQTTGAWVLAALLDDTIDVAEDLVDRLTDLRLLESAGIDHAARPRYRFHDLLRLFAREYLDSEDDATARAAAVERMIGAYLTVSRRGLYLMSPHSKRDLVPPLEVPWQVPAGLVDELTEDPYAWFADNHDALVAAVRIAAELGLLRMSYDLAEQLHYYFRVRGHLRDWLDTHEIALSAARAAGDRRAEAWTLRNLGNAHQDNADYARAATCFEQASMIFVTLGNRLGSAATLCNLGETRMVQGLFAESVDCLTRCLPDWAAVDDQVGYAYTLDNLGYIAACQGYFDSARTHLDRALAMFVDLGDRFGEAHSLRRRAEMNAETGALDEARGHLARSRAVFEEMSSLGGVAWVNLAETSVLLADGNVDAAVRTASEAVDAFQVQGDARAAAHAMTRLGEALVAASRAGEAVPVLEAAVRALVDADVAFGAAVATYHLAHAVGSDSIRRADLLREAVNGFAALPAPLWEDRARAAQSE
ncbi:tetratricopeptide repeat protein [Nocardia takedensis]